MDGGWSVLLCSSIVIGPDLVIVTNGPSCIVACVRVYTAAVVVALKKKKKKKRRDHRKVCV